MKAQPALLAILMSVLVNSAGAAERSELLPPQRRQATVEIAEQLARPPVPVPLPPNLTHPFNPEGFELPDPSEQRPVAQAGAGSDTSAPAVPMGDQQLLDTLAARIPSSGTIVKDGKPLLVVDKYRLEVGQTLTVVNPANGQEYDLELTAIDRTTFTLRYRGAVTTRPIRPTK